MTLCDSENLLESENSGASLSSTFLTHPSFNKPSSVITYCTYISHKSVQQSDLKQFIKYTQYCITNFTFKDNLQVKIQFTSYLANSKNSVNV